MGVSQDHGLGRQERFYAEAETTFGTLVKATSAGAIKTLGTSMDYQQARIDRMDRRQTRSLLERITAKREVSWNANGYLIPSGTNTTPPDIGPLLVAAFGTETVGGSDVQYSLASGQDALGSLSLTREVSGVVAEACVGAWVDKFTINVSGGDPPTWNAEGGAANHIGTGTSTLLNGLSGGETDVDVQAADVENFENGSVISVGSSDNHEVTAGGGTGTLTVTPAIVGAQLAGVEIKPYVPTETTAGSPISGVLGSIDLDGASLPFTSFEFSLTNNVKPIGDEAFQVGVTDYVLLGREVTGSIGVRARKDQIIHLGKRKTFTVRDLQVVMGTVAGKMFTVDLDTIEIEFNALDVPQVEEALITLPYRALGASGEDECLLTHS